jgi:hypothetical protein
MDFKQRQELALKEIREILTKYEVALDSFIILRAGSVSPVIDIVEAKKESKIITPDGSTKTSKPA